MVKEALSERENWQEESGKKATKAEHLFYKIFNDHFEGTDFKLNKKPTELKTIYVDIELSKETLSKIYVPTKEVTRHGVYPDFTITHKETNKILYGEIKRQDG